MALKKSDLNFIKDIKTQVVKEILDCNKYRKEVDNDCRECINACPAGKDPSITIDELNDATLGKIKSSKKVYDFAFSCMQTAKCTLACPIELKRDLMMLQLKSILSKPKVHIQYNKLRGTQISIFNKLLQKGFEFNNKKNMGLELSSYLNKEMRKVDTLFYLGCYINTVEVSKNTLKLAKIFDMKNYSVLGGLKTCCGYPQYLQGNFGLAKIYMNNLYKDIKKSQAKRVISGCQECLGALEMVKKYYDIDFEILSTSSWIARNQDKLDLKGIKKEDIIFHDSCLRCHKIGDCDSTRSVLNKFSVVDEFAQKKQNSLCCAYYAFNYNSKNKEGIHQIKKDEIKSKGHHTMVTQCVTCDDSFSKSFKDEKYEVKNIVNYLVDRLENPEKMKNKMEIKVDEDNDSERYDCDVCHWVYDENKGDPDGGLKPGTKFEDIPDSWRCPVCGVDKTHFTKIVKKTGESDSGESSYIGSLERDSDDVEDEMKGIFEKAVTGKSEISSMRSPKHKNLFDDILFLPAQLANTPYTKGEVDVKFETVIGPNAKKPIRIDLPFFVSHMSFGSLSRESKIALAKGSSMSKTLMCSGEGGILPEELDNSYRYIFEYSTGKFGATSDVMKKADGIEIKIGQAAKAGMGGHLLGNKVTEEIAKVRGIEAHKSVISPAHHDDIKSKSDLKKKVDELRKIGGGIPIGIKIVASHIEEDLKVALFAKPDFITIDCRGGATGAAPTHVKDNVCVPAHFAISRARRFFDKNKVNGVSLVITGGFRTSSEISKALAMGADVVGVATLAMIGIGCQQYRVCHKGTCPLGIATQDPKLRANFDIDKSSKMLHNLFKVYKEEMSDFVRILGKKDIHDLNYYDLVTINEEIAKYTGIKHAGESFN